MKTMKDPDQKPFVISFWETTKNALNGIALAAESERSFRIHTLAMVVVTVLGWYLELAMLEWGLLFLTYAVMMGLEMLNSAIESLADFMHPDEHPAVKRVKDMAAGAVQVAAIFSIAIAIVLFGPKIAALF
ncbi:MAG: diacylglycerol kinase family protein [Flavobacteriia bacterium]|jgi:diacylglycerol kinase|nr:diacylglycerol kinase family protein [Flavobacteriia bacterium]NDH89869.1 diacylglycerol kinase family protein [Flavobacteriia bacterium]